MNNKIKLSDIEVRALSSDAIQLLSQITLRIRKLSGKPVQLSDPRLLEKISYQYKRIDDPEVNLLYKRYKTALKASLKRTLRAQMQAA